MKKKYIGTCNLCGAQEVSRLPVMVDGATKLICSAHGASTEAVLDVIKGDRRVRVHQNKEGYTISRMHQVVYSKSRLFRSSLKGRQEYKKWPTVHAEAMKFVNNAP